MALEKKNEWRGKMFPNHNLSKQLLHQQQLEVPARLFSPIKKLQKKSCICERAIWKKCA